MLFDEKVSLSKVRFESALECLRAASTLIEANSFKSSANRSYYAVFHAMRAVLVFDEYDNKKHSGIISEFRRRYIKTGVFDSSISTIIGNLFNTRTHSDYDDFYVISKSETLKQLEDAKKMVAAIEKYLIKIYKEK